MVHSLELNSNCVQIGFIFNNLEIWKIAHFYKVFYNKLFRGFFNGLFVIKMFCLKFENISRNVRIFFMHSDFMCKGPNGAQINFPILWDINVNF